MIASLRGLVSGRTGNSVVIDVNGVGYLVQASVPTLRALGEPGNEVLVLIHTQVRQDAIILFGFEDSDEREVFLMLLGVQGVGPKMALSLLSSLSPGAILSAIAGDDRKSLCMADGVGPRVAGRLCTELRDKAVQAGIGHRAGDVIVAGGDGAQAVEDARSALVQLGYQRLEVGQMMSVVLSGDKPPRDTASIVSACLRAASARTT